MAPYTSLKSQFSYDAYGEFYATTKIYGYIKKDNILSSYKSLMAILNSSVMWFFMKNTGYVLPYGISPIYKPFVAEDVYINIINSAKKYVYIMTPYLIIDTDMQNTLVRAAKRGVPDKKIVYTQTSSFFPYLTKNGVKICKYNDGFVHSKVFVSDDTKAVVGTINMDYRSLYLHFENAIYMENVKEIKNIKKDVLDTLDNCTILTNKNVKVGFFKGIWQSILRLFAPLF